MKQQQRQQWQWNQQQSTHSPGYGDHKRSRQTNNSKNNNNNDKQTLRKKIKRWKRKTADKKKSESRMCTEMTFHFLFQPSPKKVRGFPTTTTTASHSVRPRNVFFYSKTSLLIQKYTHTIFLKSFLPCIRLRLPCACTQILRICTCKTLGFGLATTILARLLSLGARFLLEINS